MKRKKTVLILIIPILICLLMVAVLNFQEESVITDQLIDDQTPPAGTGYDARYTGAWPTVDTVVNGWDWTYKPDTTPAEYSGIYQNAGSSITPDFPGNRLKLVNWDWRDLEPTEGDYHFAGMIADLNDPAYDGVMLNIRGVVWEIFYDCNTKPGGCPSWKQPRNTRSAPEWLSGALKIQENHKRDFQITNLKISDNRVKTRLIALIKAFGTTGIPEMPQLKGAILHGVSSTLGEEWTGAQASTAEAKAAQSEIIKAWTDAYGEYAYKLAWMKPGSLNDQARAAGAGSRGGAIESWLKYTPEPDLGQLWNEEGYLEVDETIPEIADSRHFQDQNELYEAGRTQLPEQYWQMRYRHANLRALQMRRNILWIDEDNALNPQMDNWLSLELGQTATTAPDAWVLLMRTWSRANSQNREVNNLAHFLYQRDINGVSTTPAINEEHGYNASGNGLLPESLWNIDLARKADSIGIAIDDRFLGGGPHSVTIKVTYVDTGTQQWSLAYDNGEAGDSRSVTKTNTGEVKTVTFFLDDFYADATGFNFDFTLKSASADTPFMFVRVIKNS
jgi:hypothetical protein